MQDQIEPGAYPIGKTTPWANTVHRTYSDNEGI